ncbi:MAG: hypothetical protein F9K43_19565 [Bauldia sp.]|nr:MAG: hypothetical protein F9K43_19565 [Bauldia sp.]
MKGKPERIPKFRDEAEERAFWERHDSAYYLDWSKAKRAVLPNLKPSTRSASPLLSRADPWRRGGGGSSGARSPAQSRCRRGAAR